jgi:hypothetical protein
MPRISRAGYRNGVVTVHHSHHSSTQPKARRIRDVYARHSGRVLTVWVELTYPQFCETYSLTAFKSSFLFLALPPDHLRHRCRGTEETTSLTANPVVSDPCTRMTMVSLIDPAVSPQFKIILSKTRSKTVHPFTSRSLVCRAPPAKARRDVECQPDLPLCFVVRHSIWSISLGDPPIQKDRMLRKASSLHQSI